MVSKYSLRPSGCLFGLPGPAGHARVCAAPNFGTFRLPTVYKKQVFLCNKTTSSLYAERHTNVGETNINTLSSFTDKTITIQAHHRPNKVATHTDFRPNKGTVRTDICHLDIYKLYKIAEYLNNCPAKGKDGELLFANVLYVRQTHPK